MAVTHDDVRHVAELARLAVSEERLDNLVTELNGILGHMDVLSQVKTADVEQNFATPVASTPVRSDTSGPLPMLTPIGSFAASFRDGFFIVPRLASHEDASDRAP